MTKFVKGISGNPKGRPKGSKNKTTILLQSIENDLEEIIEVVKKQALAGDTTSQKLLLDRLIPTRKSEHLCIDLPELQEANTYHEKSNVVLDAVALGKLSPDHATQLINAIGNIDKLYQLDQRISWRNNTLNISSLIDQLTDEY